MALQLITLQFTLYMKQTTAAHIPQRMTLLALLLLLPVERRRFKHISLLLMSVPQRSLQHMVLVRHSLVPLKYLAPHLLVLHQPNYSDKREAALLYIYHDDRPSNAPPLKVDQLNK